MEKFSVHCLTDKEIKFLQNIKNFSFVYSFLTVFFLLILKPQKKEKQRNKKGKGRKYFPMFVGFFGENLI